jgi:hypothetical protein
MRVLILLFVVAGLATSAESRTWRVNTAGTGDAPTLHAAMDSAATWDSVLVAGGEYELEQSLYVPPGVSLIGESGPAQTLLYRDDYLAPGAVSLGGGARITGIHVRGNTYAVLFLHGAAADYCIIEALINVRLVQGEGNPSEFRNCLFIGGEVGMIATFSACIIMSDLGSYTVGSTFYVNDVLGAVDPQIDLSANFNFSLDPQFCGVEGSGNYYLKSSSPCLPENNPDGLPFLVGPLGMGCGAVRTEERTWGSIKAMYR